MSRTAFVLSGGASLGAVQVGGLAALLGAGVTPDLIVGCSAGAVNGGWLAGRPGCTDIEDLAALWRSLTSAAVFPRRPVGGLLGVLGRRRHLVPAGGLGRIVAANLVFDRLEDAPVPLAVVATDVLSGEDVLLADGDAVTAILASTAIPGVFPPVTIGGRELMDGCIVNNTPISHAVALGADVVWVLPTAHCFARPAVPTTVLGMALHALTLALNNRLASDIDRYAEHVDLRVAPPLCGLLVSPADFSHAGELIDRARAETDRWLAAGRPAGSGDALRPGHSVRRGSAASG